MDKETDVVEFAKKNLDLGLANNPQTATPLEASMAYLALTEMYSHRGDGIPTQYTHGAQVADLARTMWVALLTALRSRGVPSKLANELEWFCERQKWGPDEPEDNEDWRRGYMAAQDNLRETLKPWWPLGRGINRKAITDPSTLADERFPELGIHVPLREYLERTLAGLFGRQPDMSGDQRKRLLSHELRRVECFTDELLAILTALRASPVIDREAVLEEAVLDDFLEEWSDCGNFGWCAKTDKCTRHNPDEYRAAIRALKSPVGDDRGEATDG